jgi:uncharacterized RDD family membrane protein YckC
MKCPVCEKILAPTLSICPACGAMIGDTVREELQLNITPLPKPVNIERQIHTSIPEKIAPPVATVAPKPRTTPVITADLNVKHTDPTLVGFHSQNATLPDWRLQLQNSVRQRNGGARTDAVSTAPAQPAAYQPQTSGANALKAEYAAAAQPAQAPAVANDKLAAALKRIEESRQKFAPAAEPVKPPPAAPRVATRNYPFDVVSRQPESVAPRPAEMRASVNVPPRPKLVSSLRVGKEIFDTNKLPPIPVPAKVITSFEKPFSGPLNEIVEPISDEVIHIAKVDDEIVEERIVEEIDTVETAEAEEIEDLAPFAIRFNAGLFDLIIGGFASLILLSPFVMMGGNWFTWSGLSAFMATSAVVMFIYLTTCLGLFGKTFGMRIFSLELVDVEESDYPTFHQAALNSTIYLISLALGGIGFLTVPFNEEKRAVHDLLSGTIVVKEF